MRKAGSVGAGTDPGKVWKGTRMAGRMGNDKVTTKNIKVVKLDENENLIFLKILNGLIID
jgi:large subunit ribosomal protein L3